MNDKLNEKNIFLASILLLIIFILSTLLCYADIKQDLKNQEPRFCKVQISDSKSKEIRTYEGFIEYDDVIRLEDAKLLFTEDVSKRVE